MQVSEKSQMLCLGAPKRNLILKYLQDIPSGNVPLARYRASTA